MALHVIPFFLLFYSINLIFYFSKFNILIYIYLLIFQVLFLGVINDFFIDLLTHIIFSLFDYMCAYLFYFLNY
jgi:hypothetical protein